MKFYPEQFTSQQWKGYSLLMPCVSIGSIGQLAVDILLVSLKKNIKLVAYIEDDAVLPVTGNSDITDGICHGMEVYVYEEKKIVILQQRASFVKGHINLFVKQLLSWIKKSCFKELFLLSSVSSHIRKDEDLYGSQLRVITSQLNLSEIFHEKYDWKDYTFKRQYLDKERYSVPGGGITRLSYEKCVENDIPFTALLIYANPGNINDETYTLLQNINKHFHIIDEDHSDSFQKMLPHHSSPQQQLSDYDKVYF